MKNAKIEMKTKNKIKKLRRMLTKIMRKLEKSDKTKTKSNMKKLKIETKTKSKVKNLKIETKTTKRLSSQRKKIPNCKPSNMSPAFLGNIIWPEESPQKKNRSTRKGGKGKEGLSHSATSAKWLNYWEGIEGEKKKKEEK
ncbi:hypothetical protein J6590_045865 [Homalodisca vitripennis]|nr:hypothetical protein J6590_045865 [Homalodisca vitripennis]